MSRPRDIIDALEELAAKAGHSAQVGQEDYEAFLELTQPEIEKLAVAVMLDQEKEVRRLAGGQANPQAVARVVKLVRNVLRSLSIGLAQFDAFGRIGFVARVGPEPTPETADALDQKFALIEPVICNAVNRTLPWLLFSESNQEKLPF